MPEYSRDALAVRDVFYGRIAATHFFVEDEEQENLYEILLGRLFPRVRDAKVFPLGGKDAVLEHARTASEIEGVRRLYLLDLDFDDLLGTTVNDDRVFYLDDYCLEGALLDEGALAAFSVDEKPKIRRADVLRAISFKASIEEWAPTLDRLHRAFFLSQRHALGLRNCDHPPESFTARNGCSFDDRLVERYVSSVADALVASGVIASVAEYEDLSSRAFGRRGFLRSRTNGKFLAKLFVKHLQANGLCGNVRLESFTIRIARQSTLSRLRGFKRRVNAYLRR